MAAKGLYRTRKEQIEKDVLRGLLNALFPGEMDRSVERETKRLIAESLKTAAMIGAAEERQHCLKIIRDDRQGNLWTRQKVDRDITEDSVFSVLGYDEPGAELKTKRKGGK